MITDSEVEAIHHKMTKFKKLEFIDYGFDGVVFQYEDKILKVFPEFKKANSELIGFQEIYKFNPDLTPKIYEYGKIDDYYGIIREDIWDAPEFSEEINERKFMNLIDSTSIVIMNQVVNGADIDILVNQECDKFRKENNIDEDNELFSNELLLLVVNMQLNGMLLNDIKLENIGISSETGCVKIRDMSRFETDKKIEFKKQLLLEDKQLKISL